MPQPVSARVAVLDGSPRLLINEVPVAPLLYALTDCPGARWTWEEVPTRNIAVFAEAGVRLFQADVWFEQVLPHGQFDGPLDLTLVRRQIAGITAVCAEAKVMLRLHVNAPPAWCEAWPEECVGYADTEPADAAYYGQYRPLATDNARPRRASFSSRRWREWAAEHLADFCTRLAATPEGDALFCLQIANGVYGEWHMFGFMHHDPDTGGAATREFGAWLRQRYPEEPARWAAVPPSSEVREWATHGLVRDPMGERGVIDYYTFLHDETASAVLELARVVKAHWPRPIVTAAFFGYFYSQFGRHAAGSHLALERVLAAPELDALCSPQSYTGTARALGGSGASRGLLGPIRRAGKLWLDEMDHGTSLGDCPWDAHFKPTLVEDVAFMRRNVLQPVTRGGGVWWYDFGPVTAVKDFAGRGVMGWWDHPVLAAEVRRIHNLVTERAGREWERRADVLIVHEPRGFGHLRTSRRPVAAFGVTKAEAGDPVTPRAVDGVLEAFYGAGVVADDVLPAELPGLDLAPYRLVVFATMPVMDAEFRTWVREGLARDGRHIVALAHAGWSDGERAGAEVATAWHGFPVELRVPGAGGCAVTVGGVTEEIACETELALSGLREPETGVGVEVLGRWADGTPAAARRVEGEAAWWCFDLPPVKAAVWREVARAAGAHVVNEGEDCTLVGAGLLVVHTKDGGRRVLRPPGGPVIAVELPAASTTVWDAATGAELLGATPVD
jgi:hypothetical protein